MIKLHPCKRQLWGYKEVELYLKCVWFMITVLANADVVGNRNKL